jgi:hypothetical protein
MKRLILIPSLATLSIILCGCPFSSAYKLDENPQQPVDQALVGKWATFIKKPNKQKEEAVKLSISQKNDMEYSVSITGYIDEVKPYIIFADDSIKGTAHLSTAANKQFLNLFIKDRTYIIELKIYQGKLSFLPLAENFTSKIVKNSAGLRTAVEYHYKTRLQPMYDEDFCLKEMVKVN